MADKPKAETVEISPTIDPNPQYATVKGDDGTTFYAWRKDGRKPNVDNEQWKRNINGALTPLGDADFADRVGPNR